jgi:hypothetical protein
MTRGECPECGRTDPRAGATWGCATCKRALGLVGQKCQACGAERFTVDETGLCASCRRSHFDG